MHLYYEAKRFSRRAHLGQTRKYTGEPYCHHPERVALMVASTGAKDAVVAAALLHDVAEDVSIEKLQAAGAVFVVGLSQEDSRETRLLYIATVFGEVVASLVEQVTDVSKPEDGNRAVRKELDRQHLAKASPEGKTIKLADMIDNSRDIIKHDPGFAVTYMREKAALLEVLEEGDAGLYRLASEIVREYQEAAKCSGT